MFNEGAGAHAVAKIILYLLLFVGFLCGLAVLGMCGMCSMPVIFEGMR